MRFVAGPIDWSTEDTFGGGWRAASLRCGPHETTRGELPELRQRTAELAA